MIEFKCPKCGLLIQATPVSVGKFRKCPQCNSKIQVPLPRKTSPEPPYLDDIVNSQPSVNQPVKQNEGLGISIEHSDNIVQHRDDNRYPALKILSNIYLWAAILTAIATIIGILLLLLEGYTTADPKKGSDSLFAAFVLPFSGFFSVIVLLSISELIKVFLAIERNTRKF